MDRNARRRQRRRKSTQLEIRKVVFQLVWFPERAICVSATSCLDKRAIALTQNPPSRQLNFAQHAFATTQLCKFHGLVEIHVPKFFKLTFILTRWRANANGPIRTP